MTEKDNDSSSAIHDRLFRTLVLGIGAAIAYMEIRMQLMSDVVNKLENRFNDHTLQSAHEGAAATDDLITELIFWIMEQLDINSFPASLANPVTP